MDELLDKCQRTFDIPALINRNVLRDMIIEILLSDTILSEALNSAADGAAVDADNEEDYLIAIYWTQEEKSRDIPADYFHEPSLSEAQVTAGEWLDKGCYLVEITSRDGEFSAQLYGDKAPQCDDEGWPYAVGGH